MKFPLSFYDLRGSCYTSGFWSQVAGVRSLIYIPWIVVLDLVPKPIHAYIASVTSAVCTYDTYDNNF